MVRSGACLFRSELANRSMIWNRALRGFDLIADGLLEISDNTSSARFGQPPGRKNLLLPALA